MIYEVAFPNLGIYIEQLPRTAFSVFGFPIYFYGICIALAVVMGAGYAVLEAKRTKQNSEVYTEFLLYALIVSIIGARLYYVLFSLDYYKSNPLEIFHIRGGGLAIYGGVIGAVLTAVVYTRIKKLDFWVFMDTAIPGLILGQAIGRWGNFFNKEVFGGVSDSLLSLRYLASSVSNIPPSVAEKMLNIDGVNYIQVQPTFLYEFLWNMGVFIIMNIYKRHKKFDGAIFGIYLIGYGIGRAWIEGIRTDQLYLWNTHVPVSQLFSIVLVIAGIVFMMVKWRKKGNDKTGV